MMNRFLLLLAGCLASALSLAMPHDHQSAYAHYVQATDQQRGASERAYEAYEALHLAQPDDPLALVMLGSASTLRGRDARLPWNKMKHTETGIEQMLAAQTLLRPEHQQRQVLDMPLHLYLPFFTGMTLVELPELFGQFDQGHALLRQLAENPEHHNMPHAAQQRLFEYLSKTSLQAGDAPLQVLAERRLAELN